MNSFLKNTLISASLLPAAVYTLLTAGTLTSAAAEIQPLITNLPSRHSVSLDGKWRSIVDPFENGYYDYRLNPSDLLYAQDKDYDDPTRLQEYNFETDKTIDVPGDWNTQRPELYYYEGTLWYRTRFSPEFDSSKRQFLHFGAANYETIVWLNGERLGTHIGGFTPFNFEVTGKLRDGENSLVVKVDNKRRPEGVPTVNADWWNYGGITRPVTLIETPSTFIRDYSLHSPPRRKIRFRDGCRWMATRLRASLSKSPNLKFLTGRISHPPAKCLSLSMQNPNAGVRQIRNSTMCD